MKKKGTFFFFLFFVNLFRKKEKEEIAKNKEAKELRSYKGFMDEEKMISNAQGNAEDDFW